MKKTNAMRMLEEMNIEYQPHSYEKRDGHNDGVSVAKKIGRRVEEVYKTIVLKGSGDNHYVAVVPVHLEVSLKKVADHFGEKSVELLPVGDLQKLTGYVRGGCSPIGMKRELPTVIEEVALLEKTILVSAGCIGMQVELNPEDLAKAVHAEFADIVNLG